MMGEMVESLWCTVETNITLYINNTGIKIESLIKTFCMGNIASYKILKVQEGAQ